MKFMYLDINHSNNLGYFKNNDSVQKSDFILFYLTKLDSCV